MRQQLGGVRGRRADQLPCGPGWIGQRPQQVEDGAHLQLHPRGLGVLHGGVKQGRKEKSDPDFADGLRDSVRWLRHFNAQMFQNIGAAALRGKRSITVLGHARSRTRRHEGGHSRDIERGAGPPRQCRRCRPAAPGSTHASIPIVFSRMALAKPHQFLRNLLSCASPSGMRIFAV